MSQLLPPPTPPIALVPRIAGADTLYEIINGELKEKNVGAREIRLANLIAYTLRPFVHEQGWGDVHLEMIFRLAPGLPQRRPDLGFVSYDRWSRERPVPDAVAWEVVPDLAAEVVSPTDSLHEVYLKVHEYFQAASVPSGSSCPRSNRSTSSARSIASSSSVGTRSWPTRHCSPGSDCP